MTVRFVPIVFVSHHQDPGEADTDGALSNFLESVGPGDFSMPAMAGLIRASITFCR